MSDLIRRQDAIDAVFKLSEKLDAEILFMDDIVYTIENVPSAESERKKGKWIDTGCKKIYKCSECGNYLDFDGVNAGRGDANFCPNCGAEMSRGEE